MLTRVTVDDDLVKEARRLGGHKTKTEAAIAALREYVRQHRLYSIRSQADGLDLEPDFEIES